MYLTTNVFHLIKRAYTTNKVMLICSDLLHVGNKKVLGFEHQLLLVTWELTPILKTWLSFFFYCS